MNSSVRKLGPKATAVSWDERFLIVDLDDGRRLGVPLDWYPRLLRASPEQRSRWEFVGGGLGIHWPDVDEDLSVEGLLRGSPAPDSARRIV